MAMMLAISTVIMRISDGTVHLTGWGWLIVLILAPTSNYCAYHRTRLGADLGRRAAAPVTNVYNAPQHPEED